ncbi:MFS transporter [Cupriavidus necator]|uniref:MFS transporter n=1 Tax=Cupriavidus necator TaxID=106590 RepID=A0A367PHB2_CUPNE|nr:MFS transporter [Cupriavidus necator]QQX86670.1 MFS transporter [Cupriavidus necator]RCJ07252.1 MFS transporter [Cupriavidus necator]
MITTASEKKIPLAVYMLALGAFAIGTEGFMISPLLPSLAADLGVSIERVGQLVTVFALAYGISSPVLTAATGNLNRRTLLLASIVIFALSNLLAYLADGFWWLMGARVLLALSAGLFVPGANALAGAVVNPALRGRAIAVVNAGITVALALGVPLGAVIGHALGWRMTFAGVAVLSAIAAIGVYLGVPREIGQGLPTATLRQRVSVAVRPVVLATLLATTLWAIGGYTVYTYLSPLVSSLTTLRDTQISFVMFAWGISAAVGVFLGGGLSDRFGPPRVIVPAAVIMGLAFLSLSLDARLVQPEHALWPVLIAVMFWGVSAWAFHPAQQARLIELAGLNVASIVLSLNASFMYIGCAVGAAVGGLTLAQSHIGNLGLVGGLFEMASVAVTLAILACNDRVIASGKPA